MLILCLYNSFIYINIKLPHPYVFGTTALHFFLKHRTLINFIFILGGWWVGLVFRNWRQWSSEDEYIRERARYKAKQILKKRNLKKRNWYQITQISSIIIMLIALFYYLGSFMGITFAKYFDPFFYRNHSIYNSDIYFCL